MDIQEHPDADSCFAAHAERVSQWLAEAPAAELPSFDRVMIGLSETLAQVRDLLQEDEHVFWLRHTLPLYRGFVERCSRDAREAAARGDFGAADAALRSIPMRLLQARIAAGRGEEGEEQDRVIALVDEWTDGYCALLAGIARAATDEARAGLTGGDDPLRCVRPHPFGGTLLPSDVWGIPVDGALRSRADHPDLLAVRTEISALREAERAAIPPRVLGELECTLAALGDSADRETPAEFHEEMRRLALWLMTIAHRFREAMTSEQRQQLASIQRLFSTMDAQRN